ncbi:kinetochore Sim4 complex subunit Fta4 [Scheffersomyces coipomensis]|uniref:kinetochore Sim4 complex subunit Fta4 n=1 Tax=Scheffersomyces coipomensis TaxID=1788519 RepID=UPI00315C70E3
MMAYTYAYTKQFIDTQYKILNKPLIITPSLKTIIDNDTVNDLNDQTLQKILNKLNIIIRKSNSQTINNNQIKNQIIEQVLKLEVYKLSIVNDKLYTIKNLILNSELINNINYVSRNKSVENVDVGGKLREFKSLIDELPESKYMIFDIEEEDDDNDDDNEEDEEEGQQQQLGEDESVLVQDDQPTLTSSSNISTKRFKRVLNQRVNNQIQNSNRKNNEENAQLLIEYDQIRSQLIQLYTDLNYKYEKVQYLKSLKLKLHNLLHEIKQEKPSQKNESNIYDSDEEITKVEDEINDDHDRSIPSIQSNLFLNHPIAQDSKNDSNLISEINKFRILTEKIIYKSKGNHDDIRQIISNINHDNTTV